jgi:uncharacterized membrane protein
MNPQDFVDYFLSPIKTGYDMPKTLAYSIAFVIAAYLIFRLMKKINIKIDKRLAVALTPYVFFGGILRSLEDAGTVNSYWFVTPGIYFFVFAVVLTVLVISLVLQTKRKIPYFKILFTVGLLLVSAAVTQVKPVNLSGVFLVGLFLLPWIAIFYSIKKWGLANRIVSLTQMFDATTTFVALNFFSYREQHVLPNFFINFFGPASFIFLKLVGVVAVLVLIDRFSTDKELNNYLKLLIGILGTATGTRDLFSLISLV